MDVYAHYYPNGEYTNFRFTGDDGKAVGHCGAKIIRSDYRNKYDIEYYGYNPKEHSGLVAATNRLLCNINKELKKEELSTIGNILEPGRNDNNNIDNNVISD